MKEEVKNSGIYANVHHINRIQMERSVVKHNILFLQEKM